MTRLPLSHWLRGSRAPGEGAAAVDVKDRPDPTPAHTGLWLDRCLQWPRTDKGWPQRRSLYDVAIEALQPERRAPRPALATYRHAFRRWRSWAEEEIPGLVRVTVELATTTRVLLHPATGATVTDGSILLHHTYGVPYLPGSALKGALRAALLAAEREDLAGELLGSSRVGGDAEKEDPAAPEEQGAAALVDLLDALWVPEAPPGSDPSWSPLALDVVTPHHPGYYTRESDKPDPLLDGEEPVPTLRLGLAPGCRFLSVAEAAEPFPRELLESCLRELLPRFLARSGLGAWTAAGYGRLHVADDSSQRTGRHERRKGRPGAPGLEGDAETWHRAFVRYHPNSGEIDATLEDDRKAVALGSAARELREGLPANVLKRLKKKRTAHLEVQVESLGLSWKITALRAPGDGRGDG